MMDNAVLPAPAGKGVHSGGVPFRLINLPVRDLLRVLWRPLASGLLMLAVVLGLRLVLPAGMASAWVLALAVLTGIASYLAASWLFNREQLRETASLVRSRG